MGRNVLVTGGAGYIGSHACKTLARAGHTPVTFDSLIYGHRESVRWGPLVVGQLDDAGLLRKTLREYDIDAVMHFAAFAYVGESVRDPGKYFRNNVVASIALLDAMVAEDVSALVFSSTCAIYGMPLAERITEEHPQVPVNPYGESKLFVERALRWYKEAHGLRFAALRYFNAAGADPEGEIGEDHEPETHLIPLAVEAALGLRPSVSVFGTDYDTPDGSAIRDYIHVNDLAAAHARALDYLCAGGDSIALNLGTGRGHSVSEVIAAVQRISGCPVPVVQAPRRAGDPPRLVAEAGFAGRLLGWQPVFSDIDTIVSTALHWHARRVAGDISEGRASA